MQDQFCLIMTYFPQKLEKFTKSQGLYIFITTFFLDTFFVY